MTIKVIQLQFLHSFQESNEHQFHRLTHLRRHQQNVKIIWKISVANGTSEFICVRENEKREKQKNKLNIWNFIEKISCINCIDKIEIILQFINHSYNRYSLIVMATENVIIIVATILLYLCAINQISVTALAIESSTNLTADSDHTSYNASEPTVTEIHLNDTSQQSTKVVIDFDLPSTPQQSGDKKVSSDDNGTTPILKLIIDQSDGISVDASSPKVATTDASSPPIQSADNQVETTMNQQRFLIPPASVNASIAQMSSSASSHKQGQIIIRWVSLKIIICLW